MPWVIKILIILSDFSSAASRLYDLRVNICILLTLPKMSLWLVIDTSLSQECYNTKT